MSEANWRDIETMVSPAGVAREMFSCSSFETMAGALKGLRGWFIMSINDVQTVRDIFAEFPMRPVETTYSMGGGKKAKKAGELIIASSEKVLGTGEAET